MRDSFTAPYFVPGGTLPPNAPSYIRRQADEDLYAALRQGEFCSILTSRQVGKSSLMVQVGGRLVEAGIQVAYLNLNAIGHVDLDPEQWYFSLLMQLAENVQREDELEDFWRACRYPSPLQKWTAALRFLLAEMDTASIVIFIDEIDQVRALPFATADFFASIRDCYNRRAQLAEYRRLTFCLIGSALPTQLIDDNRVTPFNIGRRIQLRDFTPQEAAPLAEGFADRGKPALRETRVGQRARNEALLARVLYWTGGHPYLTQRMCRQIVEAGDVETRADVDRLCRSLFLSSEAQKEEDNLTFVRDRLLASPDDVAALLSLYGLALRGRPIPAAASNELLEVLSLSGIVRTKAGRTEVRNRIYAHVFDRAWIDEHMPDAEKQRQRAAFRLGVLRTAVVALFTMIFLAVVILLALTTEERKRVEIEQARLRVSNYAATMNLAQRNWEDGNVQRTLDILESQRPNVAAGRTERDLRGFEWRYLWAQAHRDSATLRGHTGLVYACAYSPDGKTLVTGGFDGQVLFWDALSHRRTQRIFRKNQGVTVLAYSRQGDRLAIGYGDGLAVIRDAATLEQRQALRGKDDTVVALAWSPDGGQIATGGTDGIITLWDAGTGNKTLVLTGHKGSINAVVFALDGKSLVSCSGDMTVRRWFLASHQSVLIPVLPTEQVTALAQTGNGRLLALANKSGSLWLLDQRTNKIARFSDRHTAQVQSLSFSPDGRLLASGSWDYTVKLWNVQTQTSTEIEGHASLVNTVAFSPDGKSIASGSNDRTVKLWNLKDVQTSRSFSIGNTAVCSMVLSPVGAVLAAVQEAAGARQARAVLWNLTTKRLTCQIDAQGKLFAAGIQSGAFSADGHVLAWPVGNGSICLWNLRNGTRTLWNNGRADVRSVCFSPNGKLLAASTPDREITLWDSGGLKRIGGMSDGDSHISAIRFSPDSAILAAAYENPGRIVLWDVASQKRIRVLIGHTNAIQALAFSCNGHSLLSCGWEGYVIVWDIRSSKPIATLTAHRGPVNDVAFSPDGETFATAGDDGVVKLWNFATRQEVAILKAHAHPVRFVGFSNDGNLLVSGDHETVRLWRAASTQEINARKKSGY